MKKILFFAAAALSLAACSNEGVITDGVDIPQPSEGTNLSLSLSLPNGEPITYAESHTVAERQIDELDVYQFDGEGETAKLEEVYRKATVGAEQAGKRSVNIYVKSKGKKQFVIVANNISGNPGRVSSIDDSKITKGTNGTTLSAFKAKVTDELNNTHMNTKPLLMTGATSAVVDVKEGTATATTTVQLTRAMARLDIKNEDNNLLIKRVKLENTSNKAFLFAHANEGTTNADGVPTGIANANNLPLVTLPTAPTAAIGYVKAGNVTTYKHVFYPYPNTSVAAASQAPTLIIEGILYPGTENAQKVIYRKPLKKATELQNLGFKRNHVYTFVISKATRDQLDATIKVDKWNEDQIPAPVVEVTTPSIIRIAAEKSGLVSNSLSAKTLTVAKDGLTQSNGALVFDVKSTTDWEMTVEYQSTVTGWITIGEAPFVSTALPVDNAINNRIRINVAANTAPSAVVRTAKLIFRSKVDPTKKVEFTLTQQK